MVVLLLCSSRLEMIKKNVSATVMIMLVFFQHLSGVCEDSSFSLHVLGHSCDCFHCWYNKNLTFLHGLPSRRVFLPVVWNGSPDKTPSESTPTVST